MERHAGPAMMASAICALAAASEIARLALGRPWPGFTPIASHTTSLLLAALLLITAVALPLRGRTRRWSSVAWNSAIAASLALALHGVVVSSIGGNHLAGVVHVALAALNGFCVKRTFDRGEIDRLRHLRGAAPRHA